MHILLWCLGRGRDGSLIYLQTYFKGEQSSILISSYNFGCDDALLCHGEQ
jgi:hypothetical protein